MYFLLFTMFTCIIKPTLISQNDKEIDTTEQVNIILFWPLVSLFNSDKLSLHHLVLSLVSITHWKIASRTFSSFMCQFKKVKLNYCFFHFLSFDSSTFSSLFFRSHIPPIIFGGVFSKPILCFCFLCSVI